MNLNEGYVSLYWAILSTLLKGWNFSKQILWKTKERDWCHWKI